MKIGFFWIILIISTRLIHTEASVDPKDSIKLSNSTRTTQIRSFFNIKNFTLKNKPNPQKTCVKLAEYYTKKGVGEYKLNFVPSLANDPEIAKEVKFDLLILKKQNYAKIEQIDNKEAKKNAQGGPSPGIQPEEQARCKSIRQNADNAHTFYFDLSNRSGGHSSGEFGQLTNDGSPFTFIFLFCDCSTSSIDSFATHEGASIQYFLQLKQVLKAHLGAEEKRLFGFLVVLLVSYLLLAFFGVKKILRMYASNERLDYPIAFLTLSIGLQVFAVILKTYHTFVFSVEGVDLPSLELGSRLMHSSAEAVLTFLLFSFLRGWGVTKDGSGLGMADFFKYAPLAVNFGLRYTATFMEILDQKDSKEYYRMFEGLFGGIELLFCLEIAVVFGVGWLTCQERSKRKFKRFYSTIGLVGLFYFLFQPLAIGWVRFWVLDGITRFYYVVFVYLLSHFLSSLVLHLTLTTQKGVYMSISFSNRVELQGDFNAD